MSNDEQQETANRLQHGYMNIYTPPGEFVSFHGQGGYESQREEARKVFTEGWWYRVESIDVGSYSSSVTFVGIPGSWNTVLFEDVIYADTSEPEDQLSEQMIPVPSIYVDDTGAVISRVSDEQVETVLGPIVDHIRSKQSDYQPMSEVLRNLEHHVSFHEFLYTGLLSIIAYGTTMTGENRDDYKQLFGHAQDLYTRYLKLRENE